MLERKTLIETMPTLMTDGAIFKHMSSYFNSTPQQLGVLYLARSGGKYVSSLVDRYSNGEELTEEQIELIGNMIKLIYDSQWRRVYDAIQKLYDPLHNFKITESETTTNQDSHNKTNDYGQYSETDVYGERQETTNYGAEQVTNQYGELNKTDNFGNRNENVTNKVNGYNGGLVDDTTTNTTNSNYVNSSVESQHTDTTNTQAKTDTTTTNQREDTHTKSGREDIETINITKNETMSNTKEGVYGINSIQSMLQAEIRVREFNFIEKMFKDIDSYLVLKVY